MAAKDDRPKPVATPSLRLDKWLFQARFFRSRGLAAAAVEAGQARVNAARVLKAGHPIVPGDTLTLAVAGRIRLIRVAALGQRRGPSAEALALYIDLDVWDGAPVPLE